MSLAVYWILLLAGSAILAAGLKVIPETMQCSVNASTSVPKCRCSPVAAESFPWNDMDCSWMNITSLPSDANLPILIQQLDLSHNHVQSLRTFPFSRWNPLKKLVLSHNGLATILEGAFTGLTKLTMLNLSHNELTALPKKLFIRQIYLHTLDLSYNNISDLHPEIFDNIQNLDSLILSYNPEIGKYIARSHEALSTVLRNGLRYLALDSTKLSFVPENLFSEAANLRELSLANNPLTHVPSLYIGELEHLNLAGISVIVIKTGSFTTLPSLKSLCLDRAENLSVVEEGAFDGMSKLENLSLENCVQLHSFNGMAFGTSPPPLQSLSLAQSGLQELSQDLVGVLGKLKTGALTLHGNPWHCDCGLAWLAHINFSQQETKLLRCYSPSPMQYIELATLRPEHFVCSRPVARIRSGLVVGLAALSGLLLLFSGVTMLDMLRRGWRPMCCAYYRIPYQPISVHIDPNRAEIVSVNVTSSSART